MKKIKIALLISLICMACKKNDSEVKTNLADNCDIAQTYVLNAQKQTITNGVWGTVSSMEGNCMPMIDPATSTCKHCPAKRTVKIYAYTLRSNAVQSANSPVFFERLNSALIATVDADADGFYQVDIPVGRYSVLIVEDGKLYANGGDGLGGINPVTINANNPQKMNLVMSYKAVF